MIRLSSQDTSILLAVLEQQELEPKERLRLLDGTAPQVREIGEALINNTEPQNPDIKEAVDAIRDWAHETRRVQESRIASSVI